MRKYLGLISLIVLILLLATPVFADTYTYSLSVQVFNNSTSTYTYLPILVSINNTQLYSLGYINSDALNTALQEGASNIPYMDTASNLTLVVAFLGPGGKITYQYRLGDIPGQIGFPIIAGIGGNVTATNSTSLNLGNHFKVELSGYIDTSVGSNKTIVFKENAFKIWVDGAQKISSSIYYSGGWTACTVNATSVLSNVHSIEVSANVTTLYLYIDGMLRDTEPLGSATVPVNSNGWVFMDNNSVAYLQYLKIWVAE